MGVELDKLSMNHRRWYVDKIIDFRLIDSVDLMFRPYQVWYMTNILEAGA